MCEWTKVEEGRLRSRRWLKLLLVRNSLRHIWLWWPWPLTQWS